MAYICNATWHVGEDSLDTVLEALAKVAPASRAEPGNRLYEAYRDPEEPGVIRLFEIYDDAEAFAAHCASEHFQQWVLGVAVPALTDRSRDFYETIDV